MNDDLYPPDTALPCTEIPSPNHGDRRGRTINAIILHYTDMPTLEAALAILRNPAAEVSSHYVVDEDGSIYQLVPEARRAWHAGRSYWKGERDLNSVSVGIEIANGGRSGGLPPFPTAQITAVGALCREIMNRHAIPRHRVLGHSDIAPGRKIDPGPRFPWRDLAEIGVGVWPPTVEAGPDLDLARGATGRRVAALQDNLAQWGAEVATSGLFDAATRTAVTAFQLHFRAAKIDGVADAETTNILAASVAHSM